jgi:hypothetical protein
MHTPTQRSSEIVAEREVLHAVHCRAAAHLYQLGSPGDQLGLPTDWVRRAYGTLHSPAASHVSPLQPGHVWLEMSPRNYFEHTVRVGVLVVKPVSSEGLVTLMVL